MKIQVVVLFDFHLCYYLAMHQNLYSPDTLYSANTSKGPEGVRLIQV